MRSAAELAKFALGVDFLQENRQMQRQRFMEAARDPELFPFNGAVTESIATMDFVSNVIMQPVEIVRRLPRTGTFIIEAARSHFAPQAQ